jgi:hypothetical protein
VHQVLPARHQVAYELAIAITIGPKGTSSLVNRVMQRYRRAVVQRMGQRRGRKDPVQSMRVERQLAQKRRAHHHGINRRTHIVDKTWQCQFRRAHASAGSVC